ncbi:MAG: PKD domain-containing protein, partial [Candidatus Micrarchaeia archaeon]
MQKGFVNFAFALFAALLLVGSAFADGNASQACSDSHLMYVGGLQENVGSFVVRLDDVTATAAGVGAVETILLNGVPLAQLAIPVQTTQTYTALGGQTITLGVCEASVGSGNNAGKWAKLTYSISSPANQPPAITTLGGPASLAVGQSGTWTLAASDPDGINLQYAVNWGDGNSDPAVSFTTFQQRYSYHSYSQPGTYTVAVTVTDAAGATVQSTITTTVTGTAGQPDLAVEALSISTDRNGVTRFVPTIKNEG